MDKMIIFKCIDLFDSSSYNFYIFVVVYYISWFIKQYSAVPENYKVS